MCDSENPDTISKILKGIDLEYLFKKSIDKLTPEQSERRKAILKDKISNKDKSDKLEK